MIENLFKTQPPAQNEEEENEGELKDFNDDQRAVFLAIKAIEKRKNIKPKTCICLSRCQRKK